MRNIVKLSENDRSPLHSLCVFQGFIYIYPIDLSITKGCVHNLCSTYWAQNSSIIRPQTSQQQQQQQLKKHAGKWIAFAESLFVVKDETAMRGFVPKES